MVPFYIIATMDDPAVILNASGIFLFGFTYLYVGVTNVGGFDTSELGWYCLWPVGGDHRGGVLALQLLLLRRSRFQRHLAFLELSLGAFLRLVGPQKRIFSFHRLGH